MPWDPFDQPKLRALEPFILPRDGDGQLIGLRDPSRISELVLSLSPAAVQVLVLMDGNNTIAQIRERFRTTFGIDLAVETVTTMLQHLEDAYFLEGPRFEAHYAELVTTYRARGVRHASAALLDVDETGETFRAMLNDDNGAPVRTTVQGIIAPHLDYARGAPCYGPAYGVLRNRPAPRRVVVLGTNHFGRSSGVVGTVSDFATPLGTTRTDVAFLRRLESLCGPLTTFELDHEREHSVELQVAWLQFLFGAEAFEIVAFLCPDPCGPTGTAPHDGRGPDLAHFGSALQTLLADEAQDTLLVAGADLSHVGANFGDNRILDESFLEETRRQDQRALDALRIGDIEAFRAIIADNGNPTRICSAGCMYTLVKALPAARGTQLAYHQAVDHETQTCVSSAAMIFE